MRSRRDAVRPRLLLPALSVWPYALPARLSVCLSVCLARLPACLLACLAVYLRFPRRTSQSTVVRQWPCTSVHITR